MTSGTPPALQLFQVLKACNRISYRKLGVLRTHFSSVPIIALTATCPTSVRRDIHKSLQLASPMLNAHSELHFCCISVLPCAEHGTAPYSKGTLVFTSPAHRGNLHFEVVPRKASKQDVGVDICALIQGRFKGKCGIVYCRNVQVSAPNTPGPHVPLLMCLPGLHVHAACHQQYHQEAYCQTLLQ
jgi:hypothetical protein